MRRGLRFLAISVPILLSLAVNIVLAGPGKTTTTKIETMTSQTDNLAPLQSDIARIFTR
jgi:hypothetical protein